MLKLTIFQKNRLDQISHNNGSSSHNISNHTAFPKTDSSDKFVNKGYSNNNSQVNQYQASSKVLPVNKKKAEFEKKIRKFI